MNISCLLEALPVPRRASSNCLSFTSTQNKTYFQPDRRLKGHLFTRPHFITSFNWKCWPMDLHISTNGLHSIYLFSNPITVIFLRTLPSLIIFGEIWSPTAWVQSSWDLSLWAWPLFPLSSFTPMPYHWLLQSVGSQPALGAPCCTCWSLIQKRY